MKTIFSDRENQHLHGTPPRGSGSGRAHYRSPYLMVAFPLVERETLTNPTNSWKPIRSEYENLILASEEAVCVCPRCRRTSGTTLSGMRSPACCRRSGAIPATPATCLSTLVRHPKLTRAYLRFSSYLLYGSTLPPRIREQVILRVAHRRGCAYEWSHHVDIGKDVGLSDADIEAVQSGDPSDEFDRAVLAAVDELDEKTEPRRTQTWTSLGERLDEHQRMDLIFTIGGYIALAMALNTFGVEVEQDQSPDER